MPALFDARLLVFDMVAGDADFHEATDQVAPVSIAAMACVGVGDGQWPVVNLGNLGALLFCHAQAHKILVAVSGEQRPDQRGCFVGDLA